MPSFQKGNVEKKILATWYKNTSIAYTRADVQKNNQHSLTAAHDTLAQSPTFFPTPEPSAQRQQDRTSGAIPCFVPTQDAQRRSGPLHSPSLEPHSRCNPLRRPVTFARSLSGSKRALCGGRKLRRCDKRTYKNSATCTVRAT